jgi:hypothetical protein
LRIQSLRETGEAAPGVHSNAAENIMGDQLPIYRVEISGWDVNEQFFVERVGLEWGQGEQKKVLLRKRVRQGALIFVRLLDNSSPSRSFPVAYRAREVREREGNDLYELTLSQVWPLQDNGQREEALLFDVAQNRALGMN